MAEIKERTLKVLQALSQMTEPTRPTEISKAIGEKPIDVGRFLAELLKGDLAEKVDEEQNLWTVTDKGAEYLSNLGKQPVSQPHVTGPVSQEPRRNRLRPYPPYPRSPTFSDPLGRSFEGHARGNFTGYCDFCFTLGEQYLRQYMLKKRGYK